MANYMGNGNDALQERIKTLSALKDAGKASEKEQKELQKLEDLHTAKVRAEEKKHRAELKEAERKATIEMYEESGKVVGAAVLKSTEDAGEKFKQKVESAVSSIASGEALGKLTSQLDNIISGYVEKQTSMTAHLVGSNTSLSEITDTLSRTLSTSSLVKQEAVYSKLSDLLSNGITYNVEQRAFLATLADDIDLTFNATNGSLTQLIRLQREDLTANRIAIEYSLQEFLNQNYNTSEYIKEAFTGVSDALLTSQSLMSSTGATQYEAMVQSWLGSYYSAGVNNSTVSNLAAAINALGSGDTSGIGKGISNLVLMGVAKAGLDYGQLLTNGIDANNVDQIMMGITQYLTEMGANSSNVVKSQLSTLFGVSISDLVAMNNMNANAQGEVSTNIYDTLLSDYDNLVPFATKFSNVLSNMMFSWGSNIASSDGQYIGYQVEKLIANSGIGSIIAEAGSSLGGLAGMATTLAGLAINNAPLLSLFTSGTLSDWISGFGDLGKSSIISTMFDALGNASSGSILKMSSAGLSESMYIGNGSTDDLLSSYKSSANDALGDTVKIENEGPTLEENVTTITENVVNIYSLLETKLDTIIAGISASNSYSAVASAVVNYSGGFSR